MRGTTVDAEPRPRQTHGCLPRRCSRGVDRSNGAASASGTRRPQTSSSPEGLPQEPATQNTGSAALETLSTDAAIRLLSPLPRTEAEAVLLGAVVGLDAAAVPGKRPGAVRVAAHRGLKRQARHVHYLPQEGRWTVE